MNKIACISGADRGLGLELSKRLAESGYRVFAGCYMPNLGELSKLAEKHEGFSVLPLDISDIHSVRNFAKKVKEEVTSVDLLVNNGAILGNITSTIFDEIDFEEIQKVFNVTALGALRMSNAFIELVMKSEQKLIVNISSEASQIAECERDAWFSYCMSKAALNMQAAIIHNKIKADGGQVLQIHPGWVKSYMKGSFDENATLTAEQSSTAIMERIKEYKKFVGEHPSFIDYSGKTLNW